MKMKELEERTGVGREAIRFYIREGLLPEPEKPRRNVAIYSEAHVNRIGLIRQLKDERFLPLGVIKDLLDDPALGDTERVNFRGLDRLLSSRLGANGDEEMSVSDFLDARSLEGEDLEAMHAAGVITLEGPPGNQILRGQDVRLAGIWADLKDAGFDGEGDRQSDDVDGFSRYIDVAETLAEAEVETFYNTVPGTRSTEDAAAIAERGISLVEELFSILHGRAIVRRIAQRSTEETGK
jgi:DNA-binding transcriptional MerR regulator